MITVYIESVIEREMVKNLKEGESRTNVHNNE